MINVGECSYQIIMATEIIGLSHKEREMVAYIVRFNHDDFLYYDELSKDSSLDMQSYLTVAKLTAILRIANGASGQAARNRTGSGQGAQNPLGSENS